MKVYNTLTNKKEEFVPLEEGKVKMYVCGPTVYNYIHIGNARPFIMFDTLRRYLEYQGYDVTYVQNFTDVDDKIIKRSHEEGISPEEVAEKYIKNGHPMVRIMYRLFFQDENTNKWNELEDLPTREIEADELPPFLQAKLKRAEQVDITNEMQQELKLTV